MLVKLRWSAEVLGIVALWVVVVSVVVLGLRNRSAITTLPELEDIQHYNPPRTPPYTSFQLLDGRKLLLYELQGKVVILNFWYLDCPPCISEMAEFKNLYQSKHPRGLELIAVNIQDSKERIQEFIQAKGIPFPIAMDRGKRLTNAYKLHFFPTSLFFNRSGKIVGYTFGAKTWSSKIYMDYVDALLSLK